ncbi:MAG: hypothetical protein H0U38_07200, partial [Chloroflexia bacterium]|nr:hypothetical protein [Chloroflexia bacterium]
MMNVTQDATPERLQRRGRPVDARRVGLGLDDIDAELGEILAGKAPGKTSAGQLTVFGGVGLALQDLRSRAERYPWVPGWHRPDRYPVPREEAVPAVLFGQLGELEDFSNGAGRGDESVFQPQL